jgi:hypothetical protein
MLLLSMDYPASLRPFFIGDLHAMPARSDALAGHAREPRVDKLDHLLDREAVRASITASVQPSRTDASNSSARPAVGLGIALKPVGAILMLAGVMYGAQYGGAICSILLNLPCILRTR